MSVNINDSLWGDQLTDLIANAIGESADSIIELDEMPILSLQVGANAGHIFEIELFDARPHKLDIDTITVDTLENAQAAISTIDQAIDLVSSKRSKFGAYQRIAGVLELLK